MPTHSHQSFPRSFSRTVVAGITAAIGLAACQPVARRDAPVHRQGTADRRAPAVDTRIHGRALILERIAVPPGATLDVQLIEEGADPVQTKVLTTEHAANLKGPPFVFDVPYDAATFRPGARHGVRAWLRDAQGTLLFATPAFVPVAPGSEAVVEFRLVRSDVR